jgi:ubiquinol oxidase
MMTIIDKTDLERHHVPTSFSDRFAQGLVHTARWLAERSFGNRYGHRAVVLETIAAVPAMAAANLLHLKHLRRMTDDGGWIRSLMDEAENQRAHLMMFVENARPSAAERVLVIIAQWLFYNFYFVLYLISAHTAHRLAAYMAEDALRGYAEYLESLESGDSENPRAPAFARAYWNLDEDACLSDAIAAIREDEAIHRDINHGFADALASGHASPGQERTRS